MERNVLMVIALALTLSINAQQNTEHHSIHFELGSAEVAQQDEAKVLDLCDRIDPITIERLSISGHTDEQGSKALNEGLSQKRAEAVQQIIANSCFKEIPFEITWHDFERPIDPRTLDLAYTKNRRVEVLFMLKDQHRDWNTVRPEWTRHSMVIPNMPMADKLPEIRTFDADREIRFISNDGVQVSIPANALLDQHGNKVTGEVQVSYRSFFDPLETVASGIPMHFNDNGTTQHFESAGMFELYAAQNGEQLTLAPENSISISMETEEEIPSDYTSFVLDPNTGEWSNDGQLTVIPPVEVQVSNMSEACIRYFSHLRQRSKDEPDTNSFAHRTKDPDYCYIYRCDSMNITKRRVGMLSENGRDQVKIPEIKLTVADYKEYKKRGGVAFQIKTSRRTHPEWGSIRRNQYFIYDGPIMRKDLKREFSRRHEFQDILYTQEQDVYHATIGFKENGVWKTIPVRVDTTGWNRFRHDAWEKSLQNYQRKYAQKAERFDRKNAWTHERWAVNSRINKERAWVNAKPAMNDREKQFVLSEWETYAIAQRDTAFTTALLGGGSPQITTALQMQGFGVFNIDRFLKMPDRKVLAVKLKDEEGEAFPWVAGYALLNDKNTLITYWGNGTGEYDQMTVVPKEIDKVFFFDKDGNMAVLKGDELDTKSKTPTLICSRTDKPSSPDALKVLADL